MNSRTKMIKQDETRKLDYIDRLWKIAEELIFTFTLSFYHQLIFVKHALNSHFVKYIPSVYNNMLQLQLVVAKSILFYIISSENGTEWTVRFTGIFCSIYKHHPQLVRQIHFWGKTCSNVRRQTYVTPAVTWPKQKQRARAGSAGKTTLC